MAARGPYAKGVAKREAILAVALDLIARIGYSNTTVREIAAAVGSTPTRVIYYFGSKEALFEEVLRRRDAETNLALHREAIASLDELRDLFIGLLARNVEVPGLAQLDSRLRIEASEPDHAAHGYFQERYTFARWAVADTIEHLKSIGVLTEEAQNLQLATMLIALVEGLQSQSLYTSDLAAAEAVDYTFALIGAALGASRVTA